MNSQGVLKIISVIVAILVAIPLTLVMGAGDGGDGEDTSCANGAGTTVRVIQAAVAGISVAGFSSEQLANAAAILQAGADMNMSRRDQTIGIMTAIGESSLTVLDHGDAAGPDSRGLFQQRDNGAWGSYEDRMNPHTSATNFFKALQKVTDRDNIEPTIVANKIQGNADPYYYATWWDEANSIVNALDGVDTTETTATTQTTNSTSADPAQAVETARSWIGVPYRWGGNDANGFDCSGMVMAAFTKLGITLPRTAAEQGTQGQEIFTGTGSAAPWDQLAVGDLIFFPAGATGSYDHIGIYAGDHMMVHASSAAGEVVEAPIDSAYWAGREWRVRRVTSAPSPASNTQTNMCDTTTTAASASAPTPAPALSGWVQPAVGPVTSPFGMRIHPVTGDSKLHAGIDLLGGGCGGAIYAANAGTVSFAGMPAGLGYVNIDHGDGLTTRYLHMEGSGIYVKAGDTVTAGQHIASVGSTGRSTGCHLHFETLVNGTPTDPAPFMAERGVSLQ